ncbi:MAG: type II toxin-antitoxin system HicB family antitoxin [bacterium]
MPKNKLLTKEHSYTVIYEPVKSGGYQATAPLLSGLVTYGRDFNEARKMARDAINCYLESFL